MATAYALRDQIVDRWLAGIDAAYQKGSKRVYYMSLEFLVGRLLFDNLNNLNTLNTMRAALAGLEIDLDRLRALEPDAALGNGGLGRLAACFMESMATLDIPAHGYGIRYEHGLFRQVMKNGWQQEFPEDWLALGNPWEFHRPEVCYRDRLRRLDRGGADLRSGGAPCLAPRGNHRGSGLRHALRRMARPARQYVAAVVGSIRRSASAGCVQPRRPRRGAGRTG